MSKIIAHVTEPDHPVAHYVEAFVKPEMIGTTTPSKEVQHVTPDEGFVLSEVIVEPIPEQYIIPSGSVPIGSNGEHNVSGFAVADVQVPPAPGWNFDKFNSSHWPTRARFVPSEENSAIAMSFLHNNAIAANITEVELYEGTTAIGFRSFQGLGIKSLIIPSTVTSIDQYFCMGCPLEYIEYRCNCSITYYLFTANLKKIVCLGNVGSIQNAFFSSNMELYDFSHCTAIPNLASASYIAYHAGTVIRIPYLLSDEYRGVGNGFQSATNWSALPTNTSLDAYIVWEVAGNV